MAGRQCRRGRALKRAAALLSISAIASVSMYHVAEARLADRGRVVTMRNTRSEAEKKINARAGRFNSAARSEQPIEGPKYRGRGRHDAERQLDKRREDERRQAQAVELAKEKEELLDQHGSLRKASTDMSSTEEFERELSQLTGCCETWSAYSAAQMCNLYGEDCNTGNEPSHDSGDDDCTQAGLSFIGVSFSVLTPKGNPYSYQLCDQYPMESLIDRDYDYVMSMDEDGWLVGGGYKPFDYSGKMPYIDSSHTELLRIGSIDPTYGGTSIEQVYTAVASITFPPFSIFPEFVKGGGGHHSDSGDDEVPSCDVTLIVSVVETYEDGSSYSSYEVFLDNLFDAMDAFGGGPCMDDHDTDPHVSMARGVKFKSSYHQQQYFYKVNLEVAVWQAMYPKGVVIGSTSSAAFPPDRASYNRKKVGFGNLYFFYDRANITKAFLPNRDLSSTESYYASFYTNGGYSNIASTVTKIPFDYSGSGSGDNDQYYEHNPYAWNAQMAKHDMTDGWDLPPNCGMEGETFFGIPLSRSSDSKLTSSSTFQNQFDFDPLCDRNFTYMMKFGTNHGWLVGEQIGNGAGSIVDKDTAHIPIFYTGTTNEAMGGMSLSNLIKVAKSLDFGVLYIKPAFVFQDDDGSIKLQFEADANSALGYLYDNLCKMIGLQWNYDSPYNEMGLYTNCAMHASGDRAKYGCGPENGGSGGFCPQMTLAYRVNFQSEEHAAAYFDAGNNYIDYWRKLYPSGVAVGTTKFCPDGGCLGLFLNRYDLYEVYKPDLGGSWVEYNGGTFAPTISPAPTQSGGCDNPDNRHLDKCFVLHHKRKASSAAWESLGVVGQFSVLLLTFMATTLAISIFLARARKRKRKGESYLAFLVRDLKRRKRRKKLRKRSTNRDLEEDILGKGNFDDDAYSPAPPPRPGKSLAKKPRSKSRDRRGASKSRAVKPVSVQPEGDENKSRSSSKRRRSRSASRSRGGRSDSRSRKPKDGKGKSSSAQSSRRQLV
uniref:Uncharacterized protein n=1 Tax=Ditylum brightwellii TaxID=49249 RepID=A0A7S4RF12_9STRA